MCFICLFSVEWAETVWITTNTWLSIFMSGQCKHGRNLRTKINNRQIMISTVRCCFACKRPSWDVVSSKDLPKICLFLSKIDVSFVWVTSLPGHSKFVLFSFLSMYLDRKEHFCVSQFEYKNYHFKLYSSYSRKRNFFSNFLFVRFFKKTKKNETKERSHQQIIDKYVFCHLPILWDFIEISS